MSKFVEKLAAEGQLTAEQVERIGSNVAEMLKAAEADPSIKARLEKLAINWGRVAEMTIPPLLAGVALTGGSALANTALSGYRASQAEEEKADNYKEMIRANPDLRGKDSKAMQRAFSTLHRFNPEYAADPMVAGAFVENTLDMARVNVDQVNQLVKARKEMSDAARHTAPAFSPQAGLDLIGVGQKIRSSHLQDRELAFKDRELAIKEKKMGEE